MALLKAAAHINDAEFQMRTVQFCAEFVSVVLHGRSLTGDDGVVRVKSWIVGSDAE
jgi:hypothetical protein